MLKKWEAAVCLGLIVAMVLSLCGFTIECERIRSDVLRLHILANSDSEQDQQLKLAVRDRLLEYSQSIFEECDDIAAAEQCARSSLALLQREAQRVIAQHGYDYPVQVEVAPSDFTTRSYDNVTLPAGEYVAVRVLIGNALGQNWWCVMFPSLCLPSATAQLRPLDTAEQELITNRPKYEVRFKIVELIEQIKAAF